MYRLLAAGLAVVLIGFSSSTDMRADADGVIIQTFLNREEPILESYEADRTLVGWSEAFKSEGRLEVRTEFNRAARTLRYTILTEKGSGLIRSRGLKAVLRSEAEAVKQGRMAQSALTPQNYDIALSGIDETGMYRLLIAPRRADALLVRGATLVTREGDLVRVEGQLAKRPSFCRPLLTLRRDEKPPFRDTSSASAS
jgi:hypothetical protein